MHPGLSFFSSFADRLSLTAAAAWSAAATATTGPAAPPTAIVIGLRPAASASTDGLTNGYRRTLNAVEVRLVLLVELLAAFLVEVVAALDQNGALVGVRLTLVKLVTRPGRRSRSGRL